MAQKPQTLDGKLAIVSGSSKGIGAAVAIELASRYDTLCMGGRLCLSHAQNQS
jgi:NAD(P)-dependent dehydrogenase (short-subunit alcohol dehydrogenase family)